MVFSAGELCCSSSACALLDTNTGTGTTWDKIPHVTQISTTEQANTPKIVTSDSAGQEIPACGTVASTGNIAIACHGGTAPGLLGINLLYRLRWSEDCDNIWDGSAAVGTPGEHFEAIVRIVTVPVDYNISGNAALIFNYGFEVYEWITKPTLQADSE